MIKTGGDFDPRADDNSYFLAIQAGAQSAYSDDILKMIKTGGEFNKNDDNLCFLAGNTPRITHGAPGHNYFLVAVNELVSENNFLHLEGWLTEGKKVFIDSGVFNLTMEHVRHHPEISMDDALALAPEKIDGFDDLFERYIEVIRKYGDRSWGYIELDQGGRKNKIKTRAKLEKMGLRPIPVYHPLNDGWDYFDYLAERYDRICFGNVVQANKHERLRLVATAWERHRKYPDLWIHLLGLTPNQWLYALPINSADSSSWLSVVRWSGYKEQACGVSIGDLPGDFRYRLASNSRSEVGSHKSAGISAYGASIAQRNWRNHIKSLTKLGVEIYPEVK